MTYEPHVNPPKVGVVGMSVLTPIATSLSEMLLAMRSGKSSITPLPEAFSALEYAFASQFVNFDLQSHQDRLSDVIKTQLDAAHYDKIRLRLKKFARCHSISTKMTVQTCLDLAASSEHFKHSLETDRVAVVIAGNEVNDNFIFQQSRIFQESPDSIDVNFVPMRFDTDHAAAASFLLEAHGGAFTVGGVCASGNHALSIALQKLRSYECDRVFVIGAMLDFSPISIYATGVKGALPQKPFPREPERMCMPFDRDRQGLVPGFGAAGMVLERIDKDFNPSRKVWAELVGVESTTDGSYSMKPDAKTQAKAMANLLKRNQMRPSDVQYINCHATSTPVGDICELEAISSVFGDQAAKLTLNAPKCLLGHTFMPCAVVESVMGILQMENSWVHQTYNIDNLDPLVKLDVCHESSKELKINSFLKNSFGFGGINSVSLFRKMQ